MKHLVKANEDTEFFRQLKLIETFKGAGFLSAISLMSEIGDFSAFKKPKLVAMGAVSHKVCNMIFAILRDAKPFEIITPQEHIRQYNSSKSNTAA